MNILINFGTGVTPLPTAALELLDRATRTDIKLLLVLCADLGLTASCDRTAGISRISQRVGCTDAQTEASLAFWRGAGVLSVTDGDNEAITAPTKETNDCSAAVTEMPAEPAAATQVHNDPTPVVKITRSATRLLDEIPNYTANDLQNFYAKNDQAATYIDECQGVWGAPFSQNDLTMVVALVDQWGFSWEYVVSLIAAVAKQFRERENQGKTMNYVYRTAVNYHKEGILTTEALQQKLVEQDKMAGFEKRIRDMFGLGSRNLTPREKKFFSAWLYEYQFSIEAVEMAYNITVDTKGSPNLNYTNGILKRWYEDGLRTVEEIAAKRAADENTLRGIREGDLNPDTVKRAVETAWQEGSTASASTEGEIGFSRDASILRRLLNLGNRLLTEGELSAMERWRREYGFSYEIIYRAYQVTLENRGDYSLPYMDAILKKWKERGLSTIEAIRAYEQGFREEQQRRKPAPAPTAHGDSSFETGDFFMAAVKRSFGEDFDPDILKQ